MRPTISPAMNTVRIAKISMPYRPDPTPPGATSPICMLNSWINPPRLVYESCAESTAPVEVSVVDAANTDGVGNTEALLDTFHGRPDRGRHRAVVLQLHPHRDRPADRGEDTHDCGDRVALLLAVDHAAEGARQREADGQQQEDLDPVGPAGSDSRTGARSWRCRSRRRWCRVP